MIALIVAHDRNRVIGLNGKMPWHLKIDLVWFKENTLNHKVVMGRKTFESLGKPLSNRENIVLTRDRYFQANGVMTCNSIHEVLSKTKGSEVFVIGGEEIYGQFLNVADALYITTIDHEFNGDTYFPKYNLNNYRRIYERQALDAYPLTFSIYHKIL